MIVEGTYSFAAPVERVWQLLLDAGVIEKAMPGAQDLRHVSDGRYEGTLKVRIGPVTAGEFALVVQLKDVRAPSHYDMDVASSGRLGFTRGKASVDLAPAADATTMTFRADLEMGGMLASLGQPLLDSISRMMTRQGLEALSAEIVRRLAEQRQG